MFCEIKHCYIQAKNIISLSMSKEMCWGSSMQIETEYFPCYWQGMLVVVDRPASHARTQSDLRQGKSNRGQESNSIDQTVPAFMVTHSNIVWSTQVE